MRVIGISLRQSYLKLPGGKAPLFLFWGTLTDHAFLDHRGSSWKNELDAASGMKTSPLPTLLLGSQAQLGRVFFEDELTAVANKAAVFKCAYKLPAEISFAATAFCYRVSHDTDQLNEMLVDPPWVVWRFRVGQRENTIYEYAIRANQWRDYEPSFLNLSAFTTTSYLLEARLQAFERALSG
ncbi:hypothetical protein ERO13_D13G020750v2 [Gossypium hirsutum]|uniref:Uncharacterized protein n=1 Tax=Gossypium hirsutum TaxID=3635 RepID=A0ABM3BFL3_GOSHI|nr:uncharacterized protein LOC121225562 [Gossypium hirsutum]KAG4109980.1 hypothetical protein ERO13_D13G020750v2 [Gossypium hirsutum]